jgi:Tfp pilus assembly protein PilN
MIKVNLLRQQAVRVQAKAPASPISHMGLLILAGFIVLAGAMGFWWYSVTREIAQLTETREKLRMEEKRLQQLKKEIAEFDKVKQLLQSRIQVIEKLKEAQTGPVQLLSHVILSIPRDTNLWLTQLDQKGDRIQIVGFAQRGESIPDFMTNLASGGIFKSVELEVMQVEKEKEKEASKFSLICTSVRKAPTE